MTPTRLLLLVFILVPLVEIYLFALVGDSIGALWTVVLVIITAVIGVSLLRWQGLMTFARVQSELQQGGLPAIAMLEGVVLLIAGALLLTPGFFTDCVGFILLIPAVRKGLVKVGLTSLVEQHNQQARSRDSLTIEGDFTRKDD